MPEEKTIFDLMAERANEHKERTKLKEPSSEIEDKARNAAVVDAPKRLDIKKLLTEGVKKKPTPLGDIDLQSTPPPSVGQLQSIKPEDVAGGLINNFYAEIGETSLPAKVDEYNKMTQGGMDPVAAGEAVGFEMIEFEADGKRYVQPKPTPKQLELTKKAEQYLENNFGQKVDDIYSENINNLREAYKQSDKSMESFLQYRNAVIQISRERDDLFRVKKKKEDSSDALYQTLSPQDEAMRRIQEIAAQDDVSPEDASRDKEDILKDFNNLYHTFIEDWDEIKETDKPSYTRLIGDGMTGRAISTPVETGTIFSKDLNEAILEQRQRRTPWENIKSTFGFLEDTPEVKNLRYNHELINLSRNFLKEGKDFVDLMDGNAFQALGSGVTEYFENYTKGLQSLMMRSSFMDFQKKMANISAGDASMDDLTNEEYLLIRSLQSTTELYDKFAEDVPVINETMKAVGGTLGFILEMAATSGVGAATGKAAGSAVVKSLSVGKMVPSLSAKLTGQVAKAMTHVAIQTTAMPSTWTSFVKKYSQGQDLFPALADAYTDTYLEVFSERLFTTPVSKFAKGNAVSTFWNRTGLSFGKIKNLKTFITSGVEEYTEEIFTDTMNAWRQGRDFTDLTQVGEMMQDVRAHKVRAGAVGIMALGGGGINKLSQLNTKRKYKLWGNKLGEFKADIDDILTTENINFEEAFSAIDDASIDYGMTKDLSIEEVIELNKVANIYATYHFGIEAMDRNAPDRTSPSLIDNKFEKQYVPDNTDTVVQGEGYEIVTTEKGDEIVTFKGKLNDNINRFAKGETLLKEELEGMQAPLQELSKSMKDNQYVNELLESIDAIVNDLKPADEMINELSEKPLVKINKGATPIEKDGTADTQRVYDVVIGEEMNGHIQETVKGNNRAYKAFDINNNPLGEFNTGAEALSYIQKNASAINVKAKAQEFSSTLSKLKTENADIYWSVDAPSVKEIEAAVKDGRLIDTGRIRGIVMPDGDIVGLHKYSNQTKGGSTEALKDAVNKGGVKLDAFDGYLIDIYKKAGFRPVARLPYDPKMAPKDTPEKIKEEKPDVVFMVYDPKNKLNVEERKFDNYEQAASYRDSVVESLLPSVKDTTPPVEQKATKAEVPVPPAAKKTVVEKTGKETTTSPEAKRILRGQKAPLYTEDIQQLKERIDQEIEKAGRRGNLQHKKLIKELADALREMEGGGRITTKEAAIITQRLADVNFNNPVSVQRFLIYADNIFTKAQYDQQLKDANSIKGRIRKSNKKGKDAATRAMADAFLDIDTSLIEDFDAYMKHGQKIISGLSKSRMTKKGIKVRRATDLKEVGEYVYNEIDRQEPIKNALSEDLSEEITGPEKRTEADKQALIGQVLDGAKEDIRKVMETGILPYTEETVALSEHAKEVLKQFLDVDAAFLSSTDGIKVIDQINNFLTNGTIDGMEATVKLYNGAKKAIEIADKGHTAERFFAVAMGDWLGENIASLPIFFENIFRNRGISVEVLKAMGLRDLWVQSSTAQRVANDIASMYTKKFEKEKPNGKHFMDADNVSERGMYAYVRRAEYGTEEEMQQEFEVRMQRLKDSISRLEKGDNNQKAMAKVYQKTYDRIIAGANTISDVEKKMDNINADAVNWWSDVWASQLDRLSEVSRAVYNKIIKPDYLYSPDIYRFIEGKDEGMLEVDETMATSSFEYMTKSIYDKESSVLMSKRKFKELPPDKFVSIDFDKNMVATFQAAMIDIHTAAQTRHVQGFVNSIEFNKIFPERTTRNVAKSRIRSLFLNMRGKIFMDDVTTKALEKSISWMANFAAQRALGSMTQSFRQTIPVAMNTVINAGNLNLEVIYNKEMNQFLDRAGRGVSIRGAEAMGSIQPLEKMYSGSITNRSAILRKAIRGQEFWLKNFLVKPDIFIARASWMTYYMKDMHEQGLSTKDIDWATHKVNDRAADYAEDMVNRQQNISDAMLLGEFLKSRNPSKAIVRKMLFPFANFALNQKMRMYTDISVFSNDVASIQERTAAIRSLSGLLIEQAVFHTLGYFISTSIHKLALSILGYYESDEEAAERKERYRHRATGYVLLDIISPIPVLDALTMEAIRSFLEPTVGPDEEVPLPSRSYIKNTDPLGMFGIALDKIPNAKDMYDMAFRDSYYSDYMGKRSQRVLYEEDKEVMQFTFAAYMLYLLGAMPVEVGRLSENIMFSINRQSISNYEFERFKKKVEQSQLKGKEGGYMINRRDTGDRFDGNLRTREPAGEDRERYKQER